MFKRLPWRKETPTPDAPPYPDLWSSAPPAPIVAAPAPTTATVAVLEPATTPAPVPTGICPRCHGERVGEKDTAARAPVCVRCMGAFAREVATERERAYLASWLHTRQEDTDRTTERLRALARRSGVDWTTPQPATTDKVRMLARLKPWRTAGTADATTTGDADDADELAEVSQ